MNFLHKISVFYLKYNFDAKQYLIACNRFKVNFFILLFLVVSRPVKGQDTDIAKIFPDAPNTATLNKLSDYPVNMSTGVPDISIPIYTIKSGGLSIPVTLRYHASGIKVSELSGWAGLGWAISAGGQISRRVQGLPDDSGNGYLQGHLRDVSGINPGTTNADVDYLARIQSGIWDVVPDVFSYSFPSKDGKFFLNGKNNFAPALIPYSPIKVIRNAAVNVPGSIESFNIVDEKGTLYDFGTNGSIETTDAGTKSKSAWMLERMITQNKRDTISFNYTTSHYSTPDVYAQSLSIDDDVINHTNQQIYYQNTGTLNPVTNSSSDVYEKRVGSIIFKNGKVVFNESATVREDIITSSNKSLDNVQVFAFDNRQNVYTLLRTIKFYQSYFIKDNIAATKRLKLDSIKTFDSKGVAIEKYKFEYNPIPLPQYTSYGNDYWGYYNGKDNQDMLIPKQTVKFISSATVEDVVVGSNTLNGREPDSLFMQAATLKKIYYPNGGNTSFEYQTNRYEESGVIKLTGGLRVLSIKNFDGFSSSPLLKTYQYYDPVKNFKLQSYYFTLTNNYNYYTINSFVPILAASKRNRTISSQQSNDLVPWDGSPVTYTKVLEYNGNGARNTGVTVYEFSSANDFLVAGITGKPLTSSFFFNRGLLKRKSVYARNLNNSYQIIKRQTNNYTAFPLTWYNNVGLVVSKTLILEGNAVGNHYHDEAGPFSDDYLSWRYARYDIPSDDNYLVSSKNIDYTKNDSTKFTTDSTTFQYDNLAHQQVNKVIRNDSKSKTRVTRTKFPQDFILPGSTLTGNVVLDAMIQQNMLSAPIESWSYLQDETNITSAQLNTFSVVKGNLGAILLDTVFSLPVSSAISDFHPATVNSSRLTRDSRYFPKIRFDGYDIQNNLIQYTPFSSPTVNIMWDYKQDMPVAKLKNNLGTFAYTSFEADGKGNWQFSGIPVLDDFAPTGNKAYDLSSGSITSALITNLASTYNLTYWSKTTSASVNGNLGFKLGTNGRGWTLFRHLIPVGISALTITGSVRIDELRLQSVGSQLSTFTYRPLLGVSNMVDLNSNADVFEYDDFQRLLNIRDNQGNIRKNFRYNTVADRILPNEVFLSAGVNGTFQKTNCTTGQVGLYLSYTESYGNFTSTISQRDADQKAIDALPIDGAANANSNGSCQVPFVSALAYRDYIKSNCGVGFTGSTVRYTVSQGTYISLNSQNEADQLAQNDINQNGQVFANNTGTCPDGTDIARWQISANIPSSTGHTIEITVTKPSGDINNVNRVSFHIPSKNYAGSFNFPAGATTFKYVAVFSSVVNTSSVSAILDSIN
jgi:hypothetical protein